MKKTNLRWLNKTWIIVALLLSQMAAAKTPSETLELAVNQLIQAVSVEGRDAPTKLAEVDSIVKANVDFDVVSQKVISKSWTLATEPQKLQFKQLFTKIVVNTYFDLLQNYSNEKVNFGLEQVKRDKFAIVDTEVITSDKKIPVRYRLIKNQDEWKIYDFIVEGVSLISTYESNYESILREKGMEGLLQELNNPAKAKE